MGQAEVSRESLPRKKTIDNQKITNIQFASRFETFQEAIYAVSP